MKATELRIDNWVIFEGQFHTITNIRRAGEVSVRLNDGHFPSVKTGVTKISPIPITGEWLERFGFELYDYDVDEEIDVEEHETGIYEDYRLLVDGREYYYACHIHSDQTIQFTMKTTWADYMMLAQIQYVHQLQNLYFALQGVEL